VSIIHEIVSAFILKFKQTLEKLKQRGEKIMEINEMLKDQQAAIEEMAQLSGEAEIRNDFVELGEITDYSISYEAKNQQIQHQKMIEHLEKQNKILKDYIRNAEAFTTNAECLTAYEDLESEELQAGSNIITTTAEVHSHDDNIDRAASESNSITVNRNAFRESFKDITQLLDDESNEINGMRVTKDFNRNDAAFDKNAKQKTKSTIKRSVSVDILEDRTFIE